MASISTNNDMEVDMVGMSDDTLSIDSFTEAREVTVPVGSSADRQCQDGETGCQLVTRDDGDPKASVPRVTNVETVELCIQDRKIKSKSKKKVGPAFFKKKVEDGQSGLVVEMLSDMSLSPEREVKMTPNNNAKRLASEGGGKFWKKVFTKPGTSSEDEDEGEADGDKATASIFGVAHGTLTGSQKGANGKGKRKRGRPPTTGKYVGLRKAKLELAEAHEREIRLQVEKEFLASECRMRETRLRLAKLAESDSMAPRLDPSDDGPKRMSALEAMKGGADAIRSVVKRSSNLKGTFQKSLKEVAESIENASRVLASLSASDEVLRLERENKKLKAEMDTLH